MRSPAKINLGLSVGPPRPDGFHPLATVYQAVALYDDVTAVLRDDDNALSVEVVGDFANDVPADETNLAVRAARLLQAEYDVDDGVELTIRKTIPVAGGMAGGSTDAAATLVACNRLWGLQLSQTELRHHAAELGSDVPFCLVGHTALGQGRGEQVTEVMSRGTFHWVFAIADGGLSTPAVYSELDRLRPLRRCAPMLELPGDGGGEDSGAGDGGFGLADHAAEAGFGEFDGQVHGAAAVGGEEQAGRAGAGDLGG